MDFLSFKWVNESKLTKEGDKIIIYAPGATDYFNNPIPQNGKLMAPQKNAPFYYTDVEGDFVVRVKVTPNFKTIYDACCIMAIQDENVWAKAAFEKSDFGTTAVVSVVTNQVSDDANGCNIESDSVWLQMVRVGNNFAIHYSLDGKTFDMVRLFTLPAEKSIKVGLEAQCPMGDGGDRVFEHLSIENRTVNNLRAGV